MTHRDFVSLYALVVFLNITITGLQHWVEYLPQHAIPATPEDYTDWFRYQNL
jgi:hypothetical protein